MSLSQEEREIMVSLEMEHARKIEAEWPIYEQNQLWTTLVNRMYYALYHASMALLIRNKLQSGTHQGVFVLLNQHFVKTGLLSIEDKDTFARLQTLREQGDYNCFIDITYEELQPFLPKAHAYIDHIAALISE